MYYSILAVAVPVIWVAVAYAARVRLRHELTEQMMELVAEGSRYGYTQIMLMEAGLLWHAMKEVNHPEADNLKRIINQECGK